jgi:hypothetical protein
MDCLCFKKLERYDRNLDIVRYIRRAQSIDVNIKFIIIYSKIEQNIKIAINTVTFLIRRGLNKICICRLQRKSLNGYLKISANILCKLEKVETEHEGILILILKGTSHEKNCINATVPSLLETCLFNLFLEGISNSKLVKLIQKGIIPENIYDQRLRMFTHLGYFNFEKIFCLTCPLRQIPMPACDKPYAHLHINT